MSFGQNFAYSKTKEVDVALMLAANVWLKMVLLMFSVTLEPRTALI